MFTFYNVEVNVVVRKYSAVIIIKKIIITSLLCNYGCILLLT